MTNQSASLQPSNLDLALQSEQANAEQILTEQSLDQQSGDSLQSGAEIAQNESANGIPIPQSANADLASAYAPAAANNALVPLASGSNADVPVATLANGIAGNVLQNDTTLAANAANLPAQNGSLYTARTANGSKETNTVKKQTGGLFARLFKSSKDKKSAPKAVELASNLVETPQQTTADSIIKPTAASDSISAQVNPAQLETAPKEQITKVVDVKTASATPTLQKEEPKRRNFLQSIFGKSKKKVKAATETARVQLASLGGLAKLSPSFLVKQTERVDIACLQPDLLRMLKKVEKHYGSPVIVTSGFRSSKQNKRIGGANGSRHTTCEAADVQIKGVSKWELAKFVRSMPERGGVGTYCHTQSVHIDTGNVRDWNWRCRK